MSSKLDSVLSLAELDSKTRSLQNEFLLRYTSSGRGLYERSLDSELEDVSENVDLDLMFSKYLPLKKSYRMNVM